ncbi:DUF3164 family protein, partial [Candidatus Pacearchaeota archaeon]|nr:DUF3164 family protein [Candidatus Pacearchaeota archaeon]
MTELNKKPVVPEGYKMDSLGRMCPIETISAIDLLRDETVNELVEKALVLQEQIKAFKEYAFGTISTFVDISAERYGATIGGKKGNVTLSSFDGSHRVDISIKGLLAFDEGILAAKVLVDECVKEWTSESRREVKAIVDSTFKPDSTGNVSIARMFALLKMEIDDERWKRAMLAIRESMTVNGSKTYLNVKRRTEDHSRYE